jgi:hypothetical protein
MPKFYVQTYVNIYVGQIEIDADSYHEAAVKAERKLRRDYVEDNGEDGNVITGQYLDMVEAEVHLGDPNSPYERARFLKLATSGIDQKNPPKFEEVTDLVWNGHKCTQRGDIHKHIADAETRDRK